MSPLIRRSGKLHLELNARHAQTELQALRAEVEGVKDTIERSRKAYVMLRDDVERVKVAVRMQQSEMGGLREELASTRREFAAFTILHIHEAPNRVMGQRE
jgi:septation ring formation regulator EzrA